MKKLMILLMLLVVTGVSCAKKDSTIVWKLGHVAADDHLWNEIAMKFADEVATRSEGKMKIQVYPNSLEGNEVDNINGIRSGISQMTLAGETLQTWAPLAAMMAVPYAFRDRDHVQAVVESIVGQEISKNIEEKAGLIPLFYILRLPRNMTANRKITNPNELKNMLLRVPAVPLFVDTWEAIGAKPTPMAFNELFTGLQQNTVEGQENPVDLIHSAGLYEVQKYVMKTEHVYQWIYSLVGVKQFNALSTELQKVVTDSADIAQEYGFQLVEEAEQFYTDELIKKGMEFVEVDKEAFAEKATQAVENALTEEQKVLYQQILQL